jgi:hypothetical protein
MKKLIYIALLIGIVGCSKDNSTNLTLVSGFYRGDNDSVFVEVGELTSEGLFEPSDNANVRISVNGIVYPLSGAGQGIYHLNGAVIDDPGHILLFVNDEINSVSVVPPTIAPISIGNTELIVDPALPGAELFGLTWNEVEGHSFVLQLECLEEVKEEIPFDVPHGLFDSQFNGPIEESSIDLYDVDFRYYGQHKLTVYVIDSDYSELFFYRSRSKRNVITAGPDNVNGAKGFWASTKAFEIFLNVQ